jgi:alpha-amylase
MRQTLRLLVIPWVLLLAACVETPPGAAGYDRLTTNVDDWRDEIIYQLVVDRFADGDSSNNWTVDRSALARYQGGDWQGVIDRTDYLLKLGVTTVWVSPPVKNVEEDAGAHGYHGYWQQDFLRPNAHFGDLFKWQEMVEHLHRSGIKVVQDIVTNHIGQLFFYDMNMNGQADDNIYGAGPWGSRHTYHPTWDPSYWNPVCRQPGAPPTCNYRDPNDPKNPDNPEHIPSDEGSTIQRIMEYDPDYRADGIHAWTSLGDSGIAPIIWRNEPASNHVAIQPPEFQNPNWYHRRGRVTQWNREQTLYGDFPGGLKDLATELPEVRRALIRVFSWWIKVGNVDGFRIDTLKHVEHEFWQEFAPAIRRFAKNLGKNKFFMFGEAFDGDDVLVGSYTFNNMVDSAFYFPQKWRVFDSVFKYGGRTREIEILFEERKLHYGATPHEDGVGLAPQQVLVNFLDNHDVARFLFDKPSIPALHSALFYLLTWDGIPCIYYGTEQQFAGGNDPANRERLWDTGYDTGNETFQFIQRMIGIRKLYPPLRRGNVVIRWVTDHTGEEQDAHVYAFERTYEDETILVVGNVSDTRTSETAFGGTEMQTSFPPGTELRNVAPGAESSDSYVVGAAGRLTVRVPARGGKILVRADRVR